MASVTCAAVQASLRAAPVNSPLTLHAPLRRDVRGLGAYQAVKILGPGPIHTSEARGVRRKPGKDASFAKELEGSSAEAASRTGEATLVASMDALLALQEVPDSTDRRSAGVRRGQDLLDQLDEIRFALLTGAMPIERLGQIVKLVRARREAFDDPKLAGILDEIELRAAVELAKLGQYP
jgi:hypothetical protein